MLRPSYHAEQTLYSSAPACSCRNSPQELLGTFPHRSSCWTQCHSCHGAKTGEAPAPLTKQCGERVVFFAHGVYCSWQMSVRSLSGGTHLFHYFFPLHWFESFLSEQGVNVGCGEAAPLNWSLFRLRYILQSWLLPPVRTCGALKWNHVLNRPQAVV